MPTSTIEYSNRKTHACRGKLSVSRFYEDEFTEGLKPSCYRKDTRIDNYELTIEDTSAPDIFVFSDEQPVFLLTTVIRPRFAMLAEKWKEETWFMSSANSIAKHWAYQEIVSMGTAAIPLILREMLREPGHWFWALNIITQFDAVQIDHAGSVAAMTQDWLDWGRENHFI